MKIAILFPGIGYHCDKPLLYYSGKLWTQYQYETVKLTYTNLSRSIPEAFEQAYAQTESSLAKINWSEYEEILFLSKSIGTAVATAYAQNHNIICRNIYYTPLAQTFDFAPQSGIVFHGTKDSWVQTTIMKDNCLTHHLPLHIIEDVNHSLELDLPSSERHHPIRSNVQILEHVMALSEAYIAHNIYYRVLCVDEICRALFHDFIRHQKVGKCWRRDNEKWIIKEDPFIDDWSETDYLFLVDCLKNTIQTGGFVYAAFCNKAQKNALKGFISVESNFFGSAKEYLDLSCIHVSEDMRGKGIGEILFCAAKDWAKRKGAKKLYISAHSAVETQAFYQSMGCVDALEYNQYHVAQEPYDRQLECVL
jgi:N-acetylglutamate synthase and related acetyltransferases